MLFLILKKSNPYQTFKSYNNKILVFFMINHVPRLIIQQCFTQLLSRKKKTHKNVGFFKLYYCD